MSNKITTEIRYSNMSFKLITVVNGLRVFTNVDYGDYCILVDDEDEVVLEVTAETGQGIQHLKISKVGNGNNQN